MKTCIDQLGIQRFCEPNYYEVHCKICKKGIFMVDTHSHLKEDRMFNFICLVCDKETQIQLKPTKIIYTIIDSLS